MMDACLHDSAQVIENERRTLEWVRNKAATIQNLHDLADIASEACRKFDPQFGMNVHLQWQVPYDDHIFDIHVGGLIKLADHSIDNMSYELCVTREIDGSGRHRVLRRYHFDYANKQVRANRTSSVFHLQYSGKLSPQIVGDYEADHMDSWLEEPRLFYFPMSLSLVLHMAFREFPDIYTDKLCDDGAWQSVFVRRDQDCLIVPFLDTCLNKARIGKKILWDAACEASVT
jgi:hypothetical protein